MKERYLLYFLFTFLLSNTSTVYAGPGGKPIEFVENRGQWAGDFLYKAITGNTTVFLEKKCFTITVGANDNHLKLEERKHGSKDTSALKYHTYKVHFVGAQNAASITGAKEQQQQYHYFLGNDKTKWRTGLHPYLTVDYEKLYNGIDLHVSSENGLVKYDLIAKPGADVAQIKLSYEGADAIYLKNENLQIITSVGTVQEMKPFAYQYKNGRRKEVSCKYKVVGNEVSFIFPNSYDETLPLIIDPTIDFATFTGSPSDNWGFTATYDPQGNLYGGGNTAGTGYPLATGTSYSGGGTGGGNTGFPSDITISKFNTVGNIAWSTYIGGSDNEQPHSMVVDPSGNLIVAGRTYSNDFPVSGAYDNTFNASGNADMVIFKLNTSGVLTASTFFGGEGDDGTNISSVWGTNGSLKHAYGDDARSEVITDNSGNVYVASCTQSSSISGVTGSLSGTQDGLVLKFNNALSNLISGSYLGGTGDDAAYVLALNNAQTRLYVAGGMSAAGLGTVTSGTVNPSYMGNIDGFIAQYDNSGTLTLQKGTYIGAAGYDQCFGIQIDDLDDVYVMGQTLSTQAQFPTTAGVFSNTGAPQFIAKIDPNLAAYKYVTRFGTANATQVNISPVAFLVDTCENVYISGWGGQVAGNGSTTAGMPTFIPPGNPVTPSGILSTSTDGSDFYFIALSKNAVSLLFAAYYGGAGLDEHVDGGTSRFDKYGVIYQAICGGCGGSSALPTTTNGQSPTNGSGNCNLAVIKVQFNLGQVKAQATAEPNATVCLGEPVTFGNTSSNATNYEWDFGDGVGTSTLQVPAPYTYANIGTYIVRMIAINPNACTERDTVYLTINVDTANILADFLVTKTDSCEVPKIDINNTSVLSTKPGAAGRTTYEWDFGDGSTFNGDNPGTHDYGTVGTYTIRLIMTDTAACNSPDTVTRTVSFNNINVEAAFEVSGACEDQDISFSNKTVNGDTYLWDFGDGKTSTDPSPVHVYYTAGEYRITMIAYNFNTCNGVDTAYDSLTIKPSPTAAFVFAPLIPETNKPTRFTNQSANAVKYAWLFGDGTGSDEVNPEHFFKRTATYTVCLVAINEIGCTDTACKSVEADVQPLVDVPTGFTPNGDGKNDVLYIRGAAIENASLKVYNRWGEKVFEVIDAPANDPKYGWDGTYKGKLQEMESYAFVMSGTFVDGTTFYKKGNVTLIR